MPHLAQLVVRKVPKLAKHAAAIFGIYSDLWRFFKHRSAIQVKLGHFRLPYVRKTRPEMLALVSNHNPRNPYHHARGAISSHHFDRRSTSIDNHPPVSYNPQRVCYNCLSLCKDCYNHCMNGNRQKVFSAHIALWITVSTVTLFGSHLLTATAGWT